MDSLQIAKELSEKNLDEKYGYNNLILQKLNHLNSPDLAEILKRDLREAVVSLAVSSYKSALILCGSIIEAVLMDQLLAQRENAIKALERFLIKDGKNLKTDDKQIEKWSLERLLDIAKELQIINPNLYHWGQGVRGFRNLVHPGVEQRKSTEVSEENADIAWIVVKKLLSDLS